MVLRESGPVLCARTGPVEERDEVEELEGMRGTCGGAKLEGASRTYVEVSSG
jgi:hypothetical protein